MCVRLGTNVPRKTSKSIGRNLLAELGRCLDDRLTLSGKELDAVAYVCDKQIEEQDFKK